MKISPERCHKHDQKGGWSYGRDMQRAYIRTERKFIPIGWLCKECNKIYMDQEVKEMEELYRKKRQEEYARKEKRRKNKK